MSTDFKPAWWMTNRHVQTIMPRFFRPFHNTRYQLEQLDTPDGDFIERWQLYCMAWKVISIAFMQKA